MSVEVTLIVVLLAVIVVGGVAGGFAILWLRASMRRLTRRIDRLQRTASGLDERFKRAGKLQSQVLREWFDGSAWPQIDALLAVYRTIDRHPALPGSRGWAASPDFLRHLLQHIERKRPAVIVECGAGTSTIAMALAIEALGVDGHIYSIEHHAQYAGQVRETLRLRGLERLVTIVEAPLAEHRYGVSAAPFQWYGLVPQMLPDKIDMLVIDGPPGQINQLARYPAGPELFNKLRSDAHVFMDDAARSDERAMIELWRDLYPDLESRTLRAEKGAVELFFASTRVAPA